MTDDIRGQVQSFLGPPHSSSQQQTTSFLSTAASPFTSTAPTSLSLLNSAGSTRPAPTSPRHAHGVQQQQQAHGGVQSQRPRGEAAFFEPEPDVSLYGSLPGVTGLGGRLSQSSHAVAAAAGGGRYGASGDPYAAIVDDSRGSSYHLFNQQSSPRHAQRGSTRGQQQQQQRGGGDTQQGPPLSLGMTPLNRGQSAGAENKTSSSSASLLAGTDRFDSYSSAFGGGGAHDTFGGNSSAGLHSNNNADYSGAVSGNLSLNFPPGLRGGQNGLGGGASSQTSLLGRGSSANASGTRSQQQRGGFGDDIVGATSSTWRMQPHEQKMPQQGPIGAVGVGGPRGSSRGTIGGPAPPRQSHMDRNSLYMAGNPAIGRNGQQGGSNASGGSAAVVGGGAAGDFGGHAGGVGGFPSLYPTSKRPRSRYDFYGPQHGGGS